MIRSLKGGTLLGVLVAALCTGALVRPSEASAYTGPPPWQNPALWTATEQTLMSPPAGLSTGGRILAFEAAAEVGAVPASGALALGLGTVVTGAGALTTGYLLGTLADRWLGISAHFGPEPNSEIDQETHIAQVTWVDTTGGAAGSSWPSNVGVIGEISWRSGLGDGTSGSGQPGLDPLTAYGYEPYDRLKVAQGVSASAYNAVCYHEVSYLCSWYVPAGALSGFVTDAVLEPYTSQTVDEYLTTWPDDDLPYDAGDPEADDAIELLDSMTEEDQLLFGQAVDEDWDGPDPLTATVPDCEGLTYSACLDLLQDEGFVGTITDTTLGYDLADFDIDPGKVVRTDPVHGTTGVAVGGDIEVFSNPDPMPLEMQAQLVNETALEWVTRIGLGDDTRYTVTYTPLTPENSNPELGPDAPYRIRIGFPLPTPVTVLVPQPGAGPGPQRVPTPEPGEDPTEVEIFTNDPDAPPATGPPSDPQGGIPGGGDGCDCPPFNLAPITDIEYGDKFPFGFPGWAMSMLDGSDDVCPAFTINPPPQLSDEPIDISLCNEEWENTYQAPVFLLLKFLMTLGAVWFICMRILGLGSTASEDDD